MAMKASYKNPKTVTSQVYNMPVTSLAPKAICKKKDNNITSIKSQYNGTATQPVVRIKNSDNQSLHASDVIDNKNCYKN